MNNVASLSDKHFDNVQVKNDLKQEQTNNTYETFNTLEQVCNGLENVKSELDNICFWLKEININDDVIPLLTEDIDTLLNTYRSKKEQIDY